MGRFGQTQVCAGFLALFAIAACSSEGNPITGARARTSMKPLEAANPVMQSVTGHWEVIGLGGNLNKVSVNGNIHEDGSVSGEVQFELFGDDGLSVVAHGDVYCLHIEGNTARIAAIGHRQGDPQDSELIGILTAIDNGEGAESPPDRASALRTVSTLDRAKLHCDQGLNPEIPVFEVQRGNIQVRP